MKNIDYYAANLERYDLDGQDVSNICGDGTPVVPYHELPNYTSIEQLLGSTKSVILLYETSYNVGHYVALYKDQTGLLHFFDSYAMAPDSELNYAKYDNTPYLSNLLNNYGKPYNVNNFRYQQWSHEINTCGRWAATRIRTRYVFTDEEFRELLGAKDLRNSPDFYISILTLLFTLHK